MSRVFVCSTISISDIIVGTAEIYFIPHGTPTVLLYSRYVLVLVIYAFNDTN